MEESVSGTDIVFERRGTAGIVTLQRAQALNALTLDMVRLLRSRLDEWEADPTVSCVVIRSTDDRAFCAGGDIRALYQLGSAGRYREALTFWREEYALNCRIKRYSKPYVALIDGIVMGGGVGISLHGSHRIAGPRYQFAMPEVSIGFFPDVGATWALPRLPDQIGTWLALTGARIFGDDAYAVGLATHRVEANRFDDILDALANGVSADEAAARWHVAGAVTPLSGDRSVIRDCFSHDTVSTILAALERASGHSDLAARAAAAIRTNAPLSLSIAREQMRRGGNLDFEEAMRTEFRIVSRIVKAGDFYEGVRAMIIDKDRKPEWSPATLSEIDPDSVAAYFQPLGDAEFDPPTRKGDA